MALSDRLFFAVYWCEEKDQAHIRPKLSHIHPKLSLYSLLAQLLQDVFVQCDACLEAWHKPQSLGGKSALITLEAGAIFLHVYSTSAILLQLPRLAHPEFLVRLGDPVHRNRIGRYGWTPSRSTDATLSPVVPRGWSR